MERAGKLKRAVNLSTYFKIKAVLIEIDQFGKSRFLKFLCESKLNIPTRDCSNVEDEDLDELIVNVIKNNLHEETGV